MEELSFSELAEIVLDVKVTINDQPLHYTADDVQMPLLTPNSLVSSTKPIARVGSPSYPRCRSTEVGQIPLPNEGCFVGKVDQRVHKKS